MLDLIDAVERLKKGIVEGGVSLGQVEQAVGKVASGIDVYLILAVSYFHRLKASDGRRVSYVCSL